MVVKLTLSVLIGKIFKNCWGI